ncbi:MAG: RNA polymerase sigma factor [Gammaproteobacteria bacterium]
MNTITRLFTGRSRSQEKFVALLRPHIDIMYRMAYRWCGNQQDAEDLVQDALVGLTKRLHELEEVEQLRPWLIKIVYRRFVDLHRKQTRRPEFSESELSESEAAVLGGSEVPVADQLMQSESQQQSSVQIQSQTRAVDPADTIRQQELIEQALSGLKAEQRDVILLHDSEGYSAHEVSEILGVSIGTVKSRLHRAREKIKKFITDGTF